MAFSRRALSLSGFGVVLVGAILVACSDGGDLVGPKPPETTPPAEMAKMACQLSTRDRTFSCATPGSGGGTSQGGASMARLYGGKGTNVILLGENIQNDTANKQISVDVRVVNLLPQAIGTTDGVLPHAEGVRTAFVTLGVTSGVVSFAESVPVGDFVGSNYPYYQYDGVVAPLDTSVVRTWKFAYTEVGSTIVFGMMIGAEVPHPNGWIDATPDSVGILPGESANATYLVRDNMFGRVPADQSVNVSVADPAIATVTSGGGTITVTGVKPGRTTVYVAHGNSQIHRDSIKVVVKNTAPVVTDAAYDAIGNRTLRVPAPGLKPLISDINGDSAWIIPESNVDTREGGKATINSDGSFFYLNAPDSIGNDTIDYRVTDGTDTTLARIVVRGGAPVWYVNTSASAAGTGRDSDPFSKLSDAAAKAEANDSILVMGTGSTADAVTAVLKDGQIVIGQAHSTLVTRPLNGGVDTLLVTRAVNAGLTHSGIGGTIRLANNVQLRGIRVAPATGAAITGTGATGVVISETEINAASGAALSLTGGTINASFGSVTASNPTGAVVLLDGVGGSVTNGGGTLRGGLSAPAFRINGGTLAVTWKGDVTQDSSAALLEVSGGHTGTVTFQDGTLAANAGTGIQFTDGDGTYHFLGSLDLSGGDAGIDLGALSLGDIDFTPASGHSAAITSPTGVAVAVAGGSADLTFNGSVTQANGAALLEVGGDHTGILTFQGGTLGASGGTGLQFTNADGTYNLLGSLNLAGGDAGIDIASASGGDILVTPAGGHTASITSPTGIAVSVAGGLADLTFNGNVTQANNAELLRVSGGHTGALVFAGGTLNASNGTGLQFDNADGTYTFNGTTTLANSVPGRDAAVDLLNGSDGVFSFGGGASITNPAGVALNVMGGTPALVFAGTISTNVSRPVVVDGITADSVVVSGDITSTGNGILVQNNAAAAKVAFLGATKSLSTGANPGVSIVTDASSVRFGGGGLSITTTGARGFHVQDGGTVQVQGDGNTINTTGAAAVFIQNASSGTNGITFRSVSSSGAANAIVLNSLTGTGFQVTGDGTANSGGNLSATNTAVVVSAADSTRLRRVVVNAPIAFNASTFGALRLDSASVTSTAGTGIGVTTGRLYVSDVAVSSTNGAALNANGVALNGTFSTLSSTTTAGNGISLANATGSFTANGGTITVSGAGSTAVVVSGNTNVGFTYGGNVFQGANAALLDVSGGHTGTLTFNTGTLSAGSGTGLQFNDADGVYNFNGTLNLSGGDAGIDLASASGGDVNVVPASGHVASILNPTGVAVNVAGGAGDLLFNGGVRQDNAVALLSVAGNHTGTLTFQGGTVNANGGTGLQFTDADGVYNFAGSLDLSGGDAGIDIAALSSGSVNVNPASGHSASITSPTGVAIAIAGGTGDLTFNGNVTQGTASVALLSVAGGHSGDVSFPSGTLTATNGTGLQFDNADGTYNFGGTVTLSNSVSGADAGIDVLNGSGGTFSFNANANITNPANQLVTISASAPNFTYAGSFTKNNNVVPVTGILVQNNTGGTIAFTGDRTTETKVLSTGTEHAVNLLNNNSSTSIQFAGGGLSIATTSGNGFNATGGGTVQVTGTENTINTTTGLAGTVALNVQNTTIGSSGLLWKSISANGGASGIVLVSTGNLNGVQVTGDGATAGSGGTIQNTSSHGVSMNQVTNPRFARMSVQNTAGSGVNGTRVTHFTFTDGTINNSGTGGGADASNIDFYANTAPGTENNLSGTVTIRGNTLSNAYYHGVDIFNYAGTIDSLGISDNVITTPTSAAASLGHGIRVVAFGSTGNAASITRGTIDNNRINNVPAGVGLQVQCGNASMSGPAGSCGVQGSATNAIRITNNQIQGQSAASPINAEGLIALVNGVGQGNFTIQGNTIRYVRGTAISHSAFGNAQVTSTISGNTIEAHNINLAQGIGLGTSYTTISGAAETPSLTSTVSSNTISQTDGSGILAVANDVNGTVRVKVLNNNVSAPEGGTYGIQVRSGSAAGNNTVCARIENNTTAGGTTAGGTLLSGIGIRKQGTVAGVNTFGIHTLSPSPATSVQAETHVAGFNAGSATGANGKRVSSISGSDYESCNLP